MEEYRAMILNVSISRKKLLESEIVLLLVSVFIAAISLWKKTSLMVAGCSLLPAIIYCVICTINYKKEEIVGCAAVFCLAILKLCASIMFIWMCFLLVWGNINKQYLLKSSVMIFVLLTLCILLKVIFVMQKIKKGQNGVNAWEYIILTIFNVAFIVGMIMMFGLKVLTLITVLVVAVSVQILTKLMAGAMIELYIIKCV